MTVGERLAPIFIREHRAMLRKYGIRRNEKIVSSHWLGADRKLFILTAGQDRLVYGPSHEAVLVRRKTWRERLGI